MKIITISILSVMLISLSESHCQVAKASDELNIRNEATNRWSKGKLNMSYSLHKNHTLSRFTVYYDDVVVCNYQINENMSVRMLVEPDSGFRVNIGFSDFAKDSSQVFGLILQKKIDDRLLTVHLNWDSAGSKFVEEEYSFKKIDPNPFRE